MSDTQQNGNWQEHRDLQRAHDRLRQDFSEHLVESAVDHTRLESHLEEYHPKEADLEAIVRAKLDETKQAGRSKVSLDREIAQTKQARVAIGISVAGFVVIVGKDLILPALKLILSGGAQ